MNFGVAVIIDYREAPNVMLVSFENRYAGVEKQKINPSMWGLNCSPLVGLRNQLPTSGEQLYAYA